PKALSTAKYPESRHFSQVINPIQQVIHKAVDSVVDSRSVTIARLAVKTSGSARGRRRKSFDPMGSRHSRC
ncbi:hypothetical protein, partial [Glutamicibacter protophormiae]|uniref:hypothetical protein n=1 Tax=Glutamicibacter protophormiae TaxID=37930 RepID=UPI003BB0377C